MIRFFKRVMEFLRRMKMVFAVKRSTRCQACGKHATVFVKNYQWSARACAQHAEFANAIVDRFADEQHKRDAEALKGLKTSVL